MRIRAARIGSFGGIRDLDLEFGDGLTAVFGENETGKTTVLEFVRGTLFPDRRNRYPARARTDRGELDIETAAGERRTLVREANKVSGDAGLPAGIDSDTFRSVFAMAPEDLRDAGIISSGEIKSRFLTVPGGEALPEVIKDVEGRMRELLSPERRSESTEIAKVRKKLGENAEALADAVADDAGYGAMHARLEALRAEHAAAAEALKANAELMKLKGLRDSQKENRELLEGLREEHGRLGESAAVADGDPGEHARLKTLLADAAEARREAGSRASSRLLGIDPDRLIGCAAGIEGLGQTVTRRSGLNAELRRLTAARGAADGTATGTRARRRTMLAAAAGALAASVLMGIAIEPLIAVIGAAVAAGIAAMAFVGGRGASAADDAATRERIDNIRTELAATDSEWEALAAALGRTGTPEAEAARLEDALRAARGLRHAQEAEERRRRDLDVFLARFGSEERFTELVGMKDERKQLATRIETLTASIGAAGCVDAEGDEPEDHDLLLGRYGELGDAVNEAARELRALREDNATEKLLDRRADLEAEMRDLACEWARLSLASSLIGEACDAVYSDLRPGVISTADRLLERMTDGRYGIEMDPRDNEIRAVSGPSGRKKGEWSTGLGDQVLLAVKLAVAKELSGDEPPPILLDDVLQMFDHGRREAACRAIADLAEDMQVIFFTCDRATASMLEATGRCKLVELHPGTRPRPQTI